MAEPITPEQRLAEIRDLRVDSCSADAPYNPDVWALENARGDLLAEVDRLRLENKRLRLDAEREEQTTGNLIDERDNFHALLDRFAAAVAPIEVIGEHSSGNDPWVNALDMVTPAAEVDRFRSVAYTQASMISELTSACMAAETERDRLKAELAEMESAAADWAARLAELRGKAETRLVELAEVESTYRKVGNKAGAARQDYAAAEIRSLFGIEWKPGGGEPRD
jgi:hypothetical protein